MSKILKGKLVLDGWWGQESAYLSAQSVLHKVKFAMIDALLAEGLLRAEDVDPRNSTPHLRLTTRATPRDMGIYNTVNGKDLEISFDDFTLQSNLLQLAIRPLNLHLTIIYKHGLGKQRSDVIPVIRKVFEDLCEGAKREAESKEPTRDDGFDECVICRANKRECCLNPCGHLCLCMDCSTLISDQCPICRGAVTGKIRVFMS